MLVSRRTKNGTGHRFLSGWALSMTSIVFSVKSWAVWTPGADGGDCWLGSARPEAAAPMALRRRVSRLGQQALRAAWDQPEKDRARLIFSSRHGEFARTLSIMDSITAGTEVSPADFTLSVHHALAGLLSIAAKNTEGHTAIAAGRESLFTALLEAAACQAEQPERPILLAHYDEPLPAPYDHFNAEGEETAALVIGLRPDGHRYRLSWRPAAKESPLCLCPAQELARLLAGDVPALTLTGERLCWTIEDLGEQIHAAA